MSIYHQYRSFQIHHESFDSIRCHCNIKKVDVDAVEELEVGN